MATQLQKDRAALVRACKAVARAEETIRQRYRFQYTETERKYAKAALATALRRVCIRANDYQAENGRNY